MPSNTLYPYTYTKFNKYSESNEYDLKKDLNKKFYYEDKENIKRDLEIIRSIIDNSNYLYHWYKNNYLPEEILYDHIKEFKDTKLYITAFQNISINFIKNHMPVDFSILSRNVYFIDLMEKDKSDSVIPVEWLDKLDWDYISTFYNLSYDFLTHYLDYLLPYRITLFRNENINYEIREKWNNMIEERFRKKMNNYIKI